MNCSCCDLHGRRMVSSGQNEKPTTTVFDGPIEDGTTNYITVVRTTYKCVCGGGGGRVWRCVHGGACMCGGFLAINQRDTQIQ